MVLEVFLGIITVVIAGVGVVFAHLTLRKLNQQQRIQEENKKIKSAELSIHMFDLIDKSLCGIMLRIAREELRISETINYEILTIIQSKNFKKKYLEEKFHNLTSIKDTERIITKIDTGSTHIPHFFMFLDYYMTIENFRINSILTIQDIVSTHGSNIELLYRHAEIIRGFDAVKKLNPKYKTLDNLIDIIKNYYIK